MDKTLYVKITNLHRGMWYDETTYKQAIYEVLQEHEDGYTVKASDSSRSIRKSDCEVVPAPISQPENEGKHLISTNQLCILYNDTDRPDFIKQYLQEWFPTVFVPAKTYKVGDRLKNKINGFTYRIIRTSVNNKIGLLCEQTDSLNESRIIEIYSFDQITEQEFSDLTSGDESQFTLLPDTTDQMV